MSDLISRQMTKQEAIERLHDLQSIKEYELSEYLGMWYKGIKDDYHEALDMAIEALEQPEPCEDAVSRSDLLHIFEKQSYPVRYDCNSVDMGMTLPGIVEVLNIAPSVTPQPKWIPCSERLPEEKDAGILKKLGTNKRSDYVIATVEVKGERMTVTACTYDGAWYWDKKYAFPDFKVIAWMPLPEPYKGDQDV